MSVRRRQQRRSVRDRGAVLPLVLLVVVIAGFVVVPLMSYTITVLKANSVVSTRTKQLEAAKGGLRAVMSDLTNVFDTCQSANVPIGPTPTVNGYSVPSTCSLVDDVGSIEALGDTIPYGAASLQLGSTVPTQFLVGAAGVTDSVAAAGTTADWWVATSADLPIEDTVWTPNVPRFPQETRTSTPFDMPAAFGCKVFFPGHYPDPLSLDPATMGTDHIYFASGVYYFEQPITVSGNIDVVVGYGIEDFGDDCADDRQVAVNKIGDPGTLRIDGGGATWVLGSDARLIVDDASGAPSIRFNQRYAGRDFDEASDYEGQEKGKRVNIMTVNGDPRSAGDHDVAEISYVPRSLTITNPGIGGATPTAPTLEPIDSYGYQPSSIALTDAARTPEAPTNVESAPYTYDDGGTPTGALKITWDAVVGQRAGGARMERYDVSLSPAPAVASCDATDQVVFDDAGTTRVTCLVTGLTLGQQYDVDVTATNAYTPDPTSAPATISGPDTTPESSDPVLDVPAAPTGITVADADVDDVARVSWDVPADGGTPITGYSVTATRVSLDPRPDLPPVADFVAGPDFRMLAVPALESRVRIPAYDPNGGPLTLELDPSAATTFAFLNLDIQGNELVATPDVLAPLGVHEVGYTATDAGGNVAGGSFVVQVDPVAAVLPTAPTVYAASITPDVNVDTAFTLPVSDPDGLPLTLTVDDSALGPDWTITQPDADGVVGVRTTAPDGLYSIPFTVDDGSGPVTAAIDVDVARSESVEGSCVVTAAPPAPLLASCDIPLPDLTPGDGVTGNLGYRFDVTARNGVGDSAVGTTGDAFTFAFDGTGSAIPPAPVAPLVPYDPEPVIDIRAAGPSDVVVSVPGYVSVPAGKISIRNDDDDVTMLGGVVAGTFDVPDTWAVPGILAGTPVGFWDAVILQRTVRIVSNAGNARSVAVVQVNQNGGEFRINSWSVQ